MAQKLTVTGIPVTDLNFVKSLMGKEANATKIYSFNMQEKGMPNPPKGLPASSNVLFTVFVNEKQLSKAGITSDNIKQNKVMVQGDIVLNLDKDICPGELGVVTNAISILQPREDQEANKDAEAKKPVQQQVEKDKPVVSEKVNEEVKAAPKEAVKPAPKPSLPPKDFENPLKKHPPHDEIIPLALITVPEEFLNSQVKPKKLEEARRYVEYTGGYLDSAIKVQKGTLLLRDGYKRYVIAKEFKMDLVPVKYV